MKLLFLLLVVSSLALAWFASQQPAPEKREPVVANLPRVDPLRLVGEGTGGPESESAEDVPEPSPYRVQTAQTAVRDSGAHGAGLDVDAVLKEMDKPLLAGLLPPPAPVVPLEAPDRTPGQEQCLVASGFESEEAAARWLHKITDDYRLTGELLSQSVAREPLHWVVVPPLDSRGAALQLLKALQGRGIDSYLVTQGEHKNAVSLGLFRSLRSARSMLRQRRDAGIDAVLTVFARSREVHSVVVDASDLNVVPDAVTENIELKIETEACKVLHS